MSLFVYKHVIYFIMISIVYGQSPYLPCSGGATEPTSYNYNNCTEYLCNITAGQTEYFTIEFVADRKIKSMQLQYRLVFTTDITEVVDFPPLEGDACDALIDADCPLKEGQKATYSVSTIVPQSDDKYMAFAEVKMVDGYNSTIFCFIHAVSVLPAAA